MTNPETYDEVLELVAAAKGMDSNSPEFVSWWAATMAAPSADRRDRKPGPQWSAIERAAREIRPGQYGVLFVREGPRHVGIHMNVSTSAEDLARLVSDGLAILIREFNK